MGIERAAMKCRHGPEESILAQCSIHGIKAEFDMGSGCCATPFKPPARPATMMVSYGAIMRQRDFLNFVSAWNTRLSVGAVVLIVLCGASAHAQLVPGDSPNTGIGAAVANTPNRPGGLSTSRVPGGTRSDAQADQHYREALKRIPDRKAPKDPWATIRTAPTADRHQPQ